jgi:hypothetical protein
MDRCDSGLYPMRVLGLGVRNIEPSCSAVEVLAFVTGECLSAIVTVCRGELRQQLT